MFNVNTCLSNIQKLKDAFPTIEGSDRKQVIVEQIVK